VKKALILFVILAMCTVCPFACADGAVVGTWQCGAGELVLSEDGSATMTFVSGAAFDMTWGEDGGKTVITSGDWTGADLSVRSDGKLSVGYNWLVFERVGGEPMAETGAIATGGAAASAVSGPAFSVGAEGDMEARLNRKFVVTAYTSGGRTEDASTLDECSVIFYENGTCDFTIFGMQNPGLSWGLGQVAVGLKQVDAFCINFSGLMFNAVLTDDGFDMDYYGSMMLHFVPVE